MTRGLYLIESLITCRGGGFASGYTYRIAYYIYMPTVATGSPAKLIDRGPTQAGLLWQIIRITGKLGGNLAPEGGGVVHI